MSTSRRHARGLASVVVVLAIVAALSACTPRAEPGDHVANPGEAGPSALVSVSCSDLAALDDIRGVLGEAVEPDDFPGEPGGTWALTRIGLQQGGALFCHWSDAARQSGTYPAELEIIALPDASAWTTWESELSAWAPPTALGDSSHGTCASSLGGSYRYCTHNVLVDGIWLYIAVNNLTDPATADPLVRTVVDAISAAEVKPASWSAPAMGITLPEDCEALLATDLVAATVATADIAPREPSLAMPLLHNVGLHSGPSNGLDCSWSNPYTSAVPMPVSVSVLPGAGWAWESEWARPRPERNPATAHPGLGDAAFSGCAADESNTCFVDVLADGAWIAVSGNKQAGVDSLAALAGAALESLGYTTK